MARKGQITKSVLLSGGMQDDVSEYLQTDPTMAYIENGRFRKKDEIEKRLPDTVISDAGLPTTGTPLLLASPKGQTLLTMDAEGTLYSLDPDEDAVNWASRSTNVIPYTHDTLFQSAPEAGLAVCQAAEATSNSATKFKVMAWEEKQTGLLNNCNVVVEVRKPNGDLKYRRVIEDARSPKLRYSRTYELPTLYYHNTDVGTLYYANIGDEDLYKGALDSGDIDLYTTQHPDVTGLQTYNASVTNNANDLRPGLCADGGGHAYWDCDFGWPSEGDPYDGACVWLDADGIRTRIAKMGTYSGISTDYQLKVSAGSTKYTPLSIAYDAGRNRSAVLFSQYDSVNAVGTLRIEIWDHDTNSLYSSDARSLVDIGSIYEGRIVTGDIVWDNSQALNSQFRFCITAVGNEPWNMSSARQQHTSRTIYGYMNTSAGMTIDGAFWNHRLATELTFDKTEYDVSAPRRLVFGVEQFNPNAVANETAQDTNVPVVREEFASLPVLIRPHTTVVVSVGQADTTGYQVIATLGAGQNKCMNASSAEQDPHLNGAYLLPGGNEPHLCVRNLLQPEDISWHLSSPNDAGKKTNLLFNGEAACRVAKLSPATSLKSRVYGEATYFASAVPCLYDGVAFGENSVFDQPEITFINQLSEGSNNIYEGWAYEKLTNPTETDDWDRFQIVIGYADHLGHLHRSAPSTPLWVSGMDAEDDNFQSAVIGFTVPLSAYRDQRDYFVEVYQAKGEGAMHLASAQRFNPSADSGDAWVRIIMHHYVSADWLDPIRWSEVIYTAGDVLPADPWPTFDDFVITSNRMFAVGSELPGTIYYSKLFEENIAPEFSAPLVLSLGRNRNLTAIGKIDDKVIIFTDDNEIFAIYDTGPDNTGANGDFVIDQLQTTIGCSDPESLVEIPDGLLFYSDRSKEFHILSRDLQVHDIGKAIDDTASTITDIKTAIVVPDEHEVRWYVEASAQQEFGTSPQQAISGIPARPPRPRYTNILPSDAVLVYNYHYKKWCVHSGQDGQHAVLYQNYPTYIESDWDLFKADPDAWGEEGHSLTLRTPWIRVNQLQSYGRIDEVSFLAKYLSDWTDNGNGFEAGDIRVTVNYDYEENYDTFSPLGNPSDTFLFRANQGQLGGMGHTQADVAEGGEVPYQYRYGRCQFSLTPGRPKCQAIQFEITDVNSVLVEVNEPNDYVLGRGFAISGADLLYSPKQGMGAQTTSQRTSK